jgi:hypothetical protein
MALYTQSSTNELRWGASEDDVSCNGETGPWNAFYMIATEPPPEGNAIPGLTVQSCAYDDLDDNQYVVLMYFDDDDTDDIPNTAADIIPGFQTDNAAYIGNEAVAALEITGVRFCVEDLSDSVCSVLCYDALESDWTYTGPIDSTLTTPFQKMVGALSGQIDDGNTENGANGNFVDTQLGIDARAPCISTSGSASPMYCWYCLSWGTGANGGQMRQWSGDLAQWHIWGHGIALFRDLNDDELAWGASGYTCNGDVGPWDSFYVIVTV